MHLWFKTCQCILLVVNIITPSSVLAVTVKSATVSITANVIPACSAGSTTGGTTTFGVMNFGTHSTLSREIKLIGQSNAGAILVQCAPGVNYQIVLGAGKSSNVAQRYMTGSQSGQRVNYNLYSDANYTAIWDDTLGITKTANGLQEWVNVYGYIPAQSTPVADSYIDTVQVTVSW